ncbi:hypothetical protein EBU24_05040, partial [bacterium]|nr:hypothetical protein [bacterium]
MINFNKNVQKSLQKNCPKKGLNRQVVIDISEKKNEPGWMTDFRLNALDIFERKPMPSWGPDLSGLDHE